MSDYWLQYQSAQSRADELKKMLRLVLSGKNLSEEEKKQIQEMKKQIQEEEWSEHYNDVRSRIACKASTIAQERGGENWYRHLKEVVEEQRNSLCFQLEDLKNANEKGKAEQKEDGDQKKKEIVAELNREQRRIAREKGDESCYRYLLEAAKDQRDDFIYKLEKIKTEEKRKAEEEKGTTQNVAAPASNGVQSVLQGSRIGEQSADELMKNGYSVRFDALGQIASSVDPENKTVILNSAASKESTALSLVHAASILRQENSGSILVAENDSSKKEVHALRKADALTAQLVFAEEMRQKNPQILETFLKNGNDPMYFAFKQTMTKTNDQNAARSAAVDCYLDAVVPDNKLGASTISLICKGFDGKGYYVAPDERAKTVSNDLFNEPAFNNAFMSKAQQGGR